MFKNNVIIEISVVRESVMRIAIYLFLAIPMLAGCAIEPETGVVTGVEIVDFGIEIQAGDRSDTLEFFEETTRIPFKTGIRYGFRFRVLGEPDGSSAQLKLLWITTPDSRTTRRARSQLFTRKLSTQVGSVYYMTSRTSWDGDLRRPFRAKFVVGNDDGTVYAEKDFWIVESED
jgi:hypothetical protein